MYLMVITILALLTLRFWFRGHRRPPPLITLTTYKDIHALLDPPATSVSTLLQRRARANARLVHAFDIHGSTFTSASNAVHLSFNNDARARLRAMDSPNRWQESRGIIQDVIEFYLPDSSTPGDYATFMQAMVFTSVLSMLFDSTSVFPDSKDVRFVTEGINELWVSSKSPGVDPSRTPFILARINEHLRNWIAQNPADPFTNNPLEIILPAYETLWRLAAHAFVYVEGSHDYTPQFVEFFANPTAMQFEFSPARSEVPSARDIMQEVLRLYPPTKRIKRTLSITHSISFPWAYQILSALRCFPRAISARKTVAADIEALQRSPVWDPLPHDFVAMRHRTSTEVQKQCFMPFGTGPLKCIAMTWAPRFAGMLVAGLAQRDDVELIRGKILGGREGWEGWKICRRE